MLRSFVRQQQRAAHFTLHQGRVVVVRGPVDPEARRALKTKQMDATKPIQSYHHVVYYSFSFPSVGWFMWFWSKTPFPSAVGYVYICTYAIAAVVAM